MQDDPIQATDSWERNKPLRMGMARCYDAIVRASLDMRDGTATVTEVCAAVDTYREARRRLEDAR